MAACGDWLVFQCVGNGIPALFFAASIVEDDEIFVNIGVKIDFTNAIRYNIVDCHIGGE